MDPESLLSGPELSGQGCVVLLSGGLDSVTTLYYARSRGLRLHAISFDYGQKHSIELKRATNVAAQVGVEDHSIIQLDTGVFQESALTDISIPVPEDQYSEQSNSENQGPEGALPKIPTQTIPITYVPGRNILFLSYALSYCESRDLDHIFIGANAVDYSGYPDCRPEFIKAFQTMANLGTRSGQEGKGIRIQAPLIQLTKAQIITLGLKLGVDYSLTSSCYQPGSNGQPCGKCDSCIIRARGFAAAGAVDPLTA